MFKKKVFLFIFLSIFLLFSGCSLFIDNKSTLDAFNPEEEQTLKVIYYDEQSFMRQFGSLLAVKYPKINFKVIPMDLIFTTDLTYEEALNELINSEQPDIILLEANAYENLAKQGKLYNLDYLISKDQFDIENIHEPLIQFLKENGNGNIYGLSPTFSSAAILYNKDLFDAYNIDYPSNNMTWYEIFDLAQKFTSTEMETDEERIYGFELNGVDSSSLYHFIVDTIGGTEGFTLNKEESFTINTDGWKNIIELVVTSIKEKSVAFPRLGDSNYNREEVMNNNLFNSGRAAMTLGYLYTLNQIENNLENDNLNWDIVTAPVSKNNRKSTTLYNINHIFAINSSSNKIRPAWEIIKYLNSAEFAKIRLLNSYDLLSRPSVMQEKFGRSLSPFYQLNFINSKLINNISIPRGFFQPISKIFDEEIQSVINGDISIEDALASIDLRTQSTIDINLIKE